MEKVRQARNYTYKLPDVSPVVRKHIDHLGTDWRKRGMDSSPKAHVTQGMDSRIVPVVVFISLVDPPSFPRRSMPVWLVRLLSR